MAMETPARTAARALRVMTWNINGLRAVLQREKTKLALLLDSLEADIICFQETKLTRSELDEELVRVDGQSVSHAAAWIEAIACDVWQKTGTDSAYQGFDAFYSFCRVRGGYSGVATFVRTGIPTPRAEEGLTGAWKTETPVGHVGELHREVRCLQHSGTYERANQIHSATRLCALLLLLRRIQFEPKLVNELEAEGRCVITDHDAFVLLNVYCPAVRNVERLEYKLAFHELLQDRVRALQRAGKFVVVVVRSLAFHSVSRPFVVLY